MKSICSALPPTSRDGPNLPQISHTVPSGFGERVLKTKGADDTQSENGDGVVPALN